MIGLHIQYYSRMVVEVGLIASNAQLRRIGRRTVKSKANFCLAIQRCKYTSRKDRDQYCCNLNQGRCTRTNGLVEL